MSAPADTLARGGLKRTAFADPRVTAADVEARRYRYLSVTFHEPLEWVKVLVPPMPKAEAVALAREHAERALGRAATEVRDYGPNYVRDARAVLAASVPRCEWFAACENPATHEEPHPVLGAVPCCDRCAKVGA